MDMTTNTRREFLKQAALSAAALAAYPPPSVLGANDRVRVGMIGAGGRGEELLKEVLEVPNAQLVAIADVYSRRRDAAKELGHSDARGSPAFAGHERSRWRHRGQSFAHSRAPFHGCNRGRKGPLLRKNDDLVHSGSGRMHGGGEEDRSRGASRGEALRCVVVCG